MQKQVKWVSEMIGEEYKDWNNGDAIIINTQTGTGKSSFIKDTLVDWAEQNNKKILYLYNRITLGNQLISNSKYSDNVDMISYQKITDEIIKHKYKNDDVSRMYFNKYDYIVYDECHYIIQDASFNNKIHFFFHNFFRNKRDDIVSIFMSATIEPMLKPLEKAYGKDKIKHYTNKSDYSYVNAYYFDNINDIAQTINNDKSGNKWLFFIDTISNAKKMKGIINNSKIICSTTGKYKHLCNKVELNNIIKESKFKCKCLIATKALDNGINIKDDKVDSIVIISNDKVDFLQMLGRKRTDIKNPKQINLYIMNQPMSKFVAIKNKYIKIEDIIDVYLEDKTKDKRVFSKMFDMNLDDIGLYNNYFYRNVETGMWSLNHVSYSKLLSDVKMCRRMIRNIIKDNNAFIKEQLSWLGIRYKKNNYIKNVSDVEEVKSLEDYLDKLEGKKLFQEHQRELSKMIMSQLITIGNNVDCRTKMLRPTTLERIIRDELKLEYAISKPKVENSRKSKMYKKSYIFISKIKNKCD